MLKGDTNKTYYQVMEYLTNEIREKNLKKGDKMPTERDLAEHLGVSRAAIRESYKILNIVGLLRKETSIGSFIKDEFDEWLVEPMSIIFKLSDTSMRDVLEFRKMIEVEVATLAAGKITDDEIEILAECYEKMTSSICENEKAQYDKLFHSIIVKAARNQIILNVYNAMSPMLRIFTLDMRTVVIENEYEGILDILHKDIYEAIVARDIEKARTAMQIHMDTIINNYRE